MNNSLGIACLASFSTACGFVVGSISMEGRYEKSAIEAEVGHYVVNPKTGSVKFEWLPKEVRTLTNIVYVTNTIYQLKMAESNYYNPKPWVTNHVIKKK